MGADRREACRVLHPVGVETVALVGIVEPPIPGMSSGFPIIRMGDGTWGRCGDAVHLID